MKENDRQVSIEKRQNAGFTLLEVMIAIVVFAILMGIISQFMNLQVKQFRRAQTQDEIEDKARYALTFVLDQTQLHSLCFYEEGDKGYDSGIYYYDSIGWASKKINLINERPSGSGWPKAIIYWDEDSRSLWYREYEEGTDFWHEPILVADEISAFRINLAEGDDHFVEVALTAKNEKTAQTFSLSTHVRLY